MAGPGGVEYVVAEDVRRTPFRVAVAPLPSLQAAVRDAAGAGRSGTPEAWCDEIRRRLCSRDYETLAPLARSGPILVPDPLVGLPEAPRESFGDALERMAAIPAGVFVEEVEHCSAQGDGAWDAAARYPVRWLRAYIAALLRAWEGFGPVWRQAISAVDREIERIGTAAALDSQLEPLDGLLPGGEVQDGRWCVKCAFHSGRMRFPDTGLILHPVVGGPRASVLARSDDVLGSVSYPLRLTGAHTATQQSTRLLEGLLGVPRSQILRAAGNPTTIGALAARMRVVPSAATHHVSALEAADLVERHRCGRHVLVRRTARGEKLLEVYE